MHKSRRQFLAVAASAALATTIGDVSAQTLPNRPIRLVLPYAAGGGADFAARLIAQKITERSGLRVIVDNRPGANGLIGTEYVAKAAPDGTTLLFCDTAHAVNSAVFPKASFNPVSDFVPLTLVGSSPVMLAAHPSLPFNSLKELVAQPKSKTETMAIGSTGQGSSPHLTYEMIHAKTGLTLLHVPYKGGGAAIADTVAGQIPLIINSMPALMPHIQAKRLKPLAIASKKRDPSLPNVETFDEAVPGMVVSSWYGILAPAGIDPVLADQLTAAITGALDNADVKKRFQEAFIQPMPHGKKEFATFLESEMRKWKEVVAQAPKINP